MNPVVWKVAAVTFGLLLLAETLVFVWMFNWGLDELEREEACVNSCTIQGHMAYQLFEDRCYCLTETADWIEGEQNE